MIQTWHPILKLNKEADKMEIFEHRNSNIDYFYNNQSASLRWEQMQMSPAYQFLNGESRC